MASLRFTLAAVLAAASVLGACQPKAAAPAVTADEMSLGNPNAKVTLVEYASAGCPFCAHFDTDIFPAFKAKYIDTGKVHYVFREVLVGGGSEMAMGAAGFLLARCQGPDKYFPILDQVFRAQEGIYKSGDVHGGLLQVAKANGMSDKQFDDCVTNTDSLAAVNARSEKAAADGVNSTPTFFINGKKFYEGVPPKDELEAAVQAAS